MFEVREEVDPSVPPKRGDTGDKWGQIGTGGHLEWGGCILGGIWGNNVATYDGGSGRVRQM